MIRSAMISLAAAMALTGCEDPKTAILFDGMRYSGRLQADSDDRRNFTAQAGPVSQGLDGAREAARYEGTTYCIRKYGRSTIDWTQSPEADEDALSIIENRLQVAGRCAE